MWCRSTICRLCVSRIMQTESLMLDMFHHCLLDLFLLAVFMVVCTAKQASFSDIFCSIFIFILIKIDWMLNYVAGSPSSPTTGSLIQGIGSALVTTANATSNITATTMVRGPRPTPPNTLNLMCSASSHTNSLATSGLQSRHTVFFFSLTVPCKVVVGVRECSYFHGIYCITEHPLAVKGHCCMIGWLVTEIYPSW